MRFSLRLLLLPMIFALSLLAPAQAQTLKMTSIYDVTLGMPLDEGVSILRDAGFVFETSPSGDIYIHEQSADHYEGAPVFFRATSATLESEGISTHLMALRVPDAAEDAWSIAAIVREQSFDAAELKPLHKDLQTQVDERLGVDEAPCYLTPQKLEYVYVFDDAGAFVTGDVDDAFCENIETSFQDGDFATAVMINAHASTEDTDRISTFVISLMDGKLANIRHQIATGIYGKKAPTIGDF